MWRVIIQPDRYLTWRINKVAEARPRLWIHILSFKSCRSLVLNHSVYKTTGPLSRLGIDSFLCWILVSSVSSRPHTICFSWMKWICPLVKSIRLPQLHLDSPQQLFTKYCVNPNMTCSSCVRQSVLNFLQNFFSFTLCLVYLTYKFLILAARLSHSLVRVTNVCQCVSTLQAAVWTVDAVITVWVGSG